MLRNFAALKHAHLTPGTGFAQPMQALPERVSFDDPALSVMTDFERVSAILIRPADTVEEANRRMIQRGVRLLLVVDEHRRVAGVITATDVLGEKPMQVLAERGGRHSEILVRDIMAPESVLEALAYEDVQRARVGHIVTTLRESGRQHTLVVDRTRDGHQRVRGVFSVTQIARQLGVAVQASGAAKTFAEIEALLTH